MSWLSMVNANLEVRETLNAALMALNFVLLIMIARQLAMAWNRHGWSWHREPGIIAACAFWWVFFSDFLRACLAWYFLHEQGAGRTTSWMSPTYTFFYMSAIVIGTAATLRVVYALSPPNWGHKGWLSAAALTVATVFFFQNLD